MSKIERKYKDYYGNARSLFWMVRNEPQWAESRILCCESAEAELETLQAALAAKDAELANAQEALKTIYLYTEDPITLPDYVNKIRMQIREALK